MLRRSWKVVRVSKDRKIDLPEPFFLFLAKTHFLSSYSSELIFDLIFWGVSKNGFDNLEYETRYLWGAVSKVTKMWKKKTFFRKIQLISIFFSYRSLKSAKNSIFVIWSKIHHFYHETPKSRNRSHKKGRVEGGVSKAILICQICNINYLHGSKHGKFF